MIGCSECCLDLACCDFCIHAGHEEWDEINPTTGEKAHIIGGPNKCFYHQRDLKYQLIAENNGLCNDFHCENAQAPEYWVEREYNGNS